MEFTALSSEIFQLDVCTITIKIFGVPHREIRTVHFLDGAAPCFQPDRLYIGTADLLPEASAPDEAVNLILCGPEDVPVRTMGAKGLNYLQIENRDAAPLIYNRLRVALSPRPAAELRTMQEMTDALLSGKGLQHLTDVATRVLGNPVRISDMSYNYLAHPDIDSSPDPFLQEFIDGHTRADHVDYGNQQRLRERQRDMRYPILNPIPPQEQSPAVLGTAILTAAVFIQGIVVAYCSAYDAFHPYRPEDFDLLSYFCRLVSLELQKSSYYAENKGMLYSYFLHDLLTNRLPNIKNVRERLHTIGWTPKPDLYVLTVDLSGLSSLSTNPSVIAERLRAIAGHSIYTIMGDVIALLLSRETDDSSDNAPLQKFLKDANLHAGLSARFADILLAPTAYESALTAAKLGTLLDPTQHLYRFPDYAVAYLLQGQDQKLLLSALGGGALPRLLAHDREQSPPLLPTLRVWLNRDMSSSAAAAALGIHKNTLLYRLEKIRALTGLSLSGGEELLQLLLALKLLDLSSGSL